MGGAFKGETRARNLQNNEGISEKERGYWSANVFKSVEESLKTL